MDKSEFDTTVFARGIGMSRSHLNVKIKVLTGFATSEFIRHMRLKHAAQLIKADHGNISEIAYQVERWYRFVTGQANRMERARERDVVEIMACGLRQRPILPPARHAAIDETPVSLQTNIRSDAGALHDARAESFNQDIRIFKQSKQNFDAIGRLQIYCD